MITYVDTSSLLKLLVDEVGSDQVEALWDASEVLASSALIRVEARAALAAAHRHRRITASQQQEALTHLALLIDQLLIVRVTDELIVTAGELAEQEALRAYDAVHLAAALSLETDVISSADLELCNAASRRGMHVSNPLGS